MRNHFEILVGQISYAACYFAFSLLLISRASAADPLLFAQASAATGFSLEFVLGTASAVLTILLAIVSYFLVRTLNQFDQSVTTLSKKIDGLQQTITDLRERTAVLEVQIEHKKK